MNRGPWVSGLRRMKTPTMKRTMATASQTFHISEKCTITFWLNFFGSEHTICANTKQWKQRWLPIVCLFKSISHESTVSQLVRKINSDVYKHFSLILKCALRNEKTIWLKTIISNKNSSLAARSALFFAKLTRSVFINTVFLGNCFPSDQTLKPGEGEASEGDSTSLMISMPMVKM